MPKQVSAAAAYDGFRLGKYALVVTMDDSGVHYRYDPARPESVLAKSQVDDVIENRRRPQESHRHLGDSVERAGRALHRLPHPRPAGHEPDELRHVGHRLRAGRYAAAQTAEALRGHAHAADRFPARAGQQPPGADAHRGGTAAWLRRAVLSHARRGLDSDRFCWSARWARFRSAASAC